MKVWVGFETTSAAGRPAFLPAASIQVLAMQAGAGMTFLVV